MKHKIGKIILPIMVLLSVAIMLFVIFSPLQAVPIGGTYPERLGSFTGPVGGTNQDDNIKASLDLAHTDLDAMITYDEDVLALLGLGGVANVWYVDAAETTGTEDGTTWATATDTVQEAIDLAGIVDDDGDIILIAEGHTETLTAADDIDLDEAGIKLIGLGVGEARPTFTYTANGELVFGADDCEIHNLNFIAGNAVTHAIDVEAGVENYVINNCRFWTTSVNTDEFIDCIDIAAGSDNGKITNCEFEIGAAAAVSAISHIGSDFTEISGNLFSGDFSTACIEDATTTSLWMIIKDNILINGDTAGALNGVAAISLKAETSALVLDNKIFCDMTRAGSVVAAAGYLSGNSYNGTIGSGTFLEVGKVYTLKKTSVVTASNDDLFAVVGGAIEIISFFGQVTTIIADAPGNVSIIFDSADNNYDADFSIAVALGNGSLGDVITFGAITNAENAGVLQANENAGYPLSWFCPAGSIEQLLSGTGTGAVTWYMTFRPLDEGVTVTVE